MEVCIFKICKIIDFEYAKEEIKKSLTAKFQNKGGNVLEKNLVAENDVTKSTMWNITTNLYLKWFNMCR